MADNDFEDVNYSVNGSYLHEAAKRGHAEQIVEALQTQKEKVNLQDESGNTPLHWYDSKS
jgi:ankyrin repeat protein